MAVRRVLLVTPIRPGLVGSGLAHRAGAWQRALAAIAEVQTLVVPVADPGAHASAGAPQPGHAIIRLPDATAHELGAIRGMANPTVRSLMATFDDVPAMAAAAPPWLGAAEDATRFDDTDAKPFDVVVCCRSYLAPFVAGLRAGSSAVAAARVIVDLDDDDAAYHRSRGEHGAAARYERLVARLVDDGATLVAAGRHTAPGVGTVPNCVELPAAATADLDAAIGPVKGRILLVANLTYAPNIDGVEWYLREVHPIVVAARPDATLRLVGRGGERWAGEPGAQVAGLVDNLTPEYAAAAVVIAPVRLGSGTRIKVLEAWAHARPVVATTAAVDGLILDASVHAELADAPAAFARAVLDILSHPARAAALATAGRAHVAQHYSSAVFDRAVAALIGDGSPRAADPSR